MDHRKLPCITEEDPNFEVAARVLYIWRDLVVADMIYMPPTNIAIHRISRIVNQVP